MKNIGKILTVCAVLLTASVAFAGPPPCHHDRGNSGVRLAADIVGLVGASLDILSPRPVIVTQPAVTEVVYTPATQVIYTTPAPVVYTRPVYRWTPPPPPPPRHHSGHGHHHPAPAPHHCGRR
jgi:hypothetical protein